MLHNIYTDVYVTSVCLYYEGKCKKRTKKYPPWSLCTPHSPPSHPLLSTLPPIHHTYMYKAQDAPPLPPLFLLSLSPPSPLPKPSLLLYPPPPQNIMPRLRLPINAYTLNREFFLWYFLLKHANVYKKKRHYAWIIVNFVFFRLVQQAS